MKEIVCNYAIARFRPYRETGEFANIGVVLICPQLDYFGYTFETRKHKRITDFFPELDLEIFKAGLAGQLKELGRNPALKPLERAARESSRSANGTPAEMQKQIDSLFATQFPHCPLCPPRRVDARR